MNDETNSSDVSRQISMPNNWETKCLADIAIEFISGGTPSTKELDFWDGEIPWTTSAPIYEQDVLLNKAQRFITQRGLENSASNIVPKGNLIVGTRVGVGKAVTNTIEMAISQDLTGVVLDYNKVQPEFLSYYFKTITVQQFFNGRKRGTTIKGISRYDLQSVAINLPPLPEQRAIARALRAVQDAREARLRELERERKAALMEQLFTHGTRGEATKMTEIGEMPESWILIGLDKIIIDGPQNGIYKPLELYGSGTQIIRIDVFNNDGLFINTDFKRVILSLEEIENYKVNKNDIIINRVNSLSHLGKSALISDLRETCVFESNMMKFHANEGKVYPEFLWRYLITNDNKNRIRNMAKRAVAQSSINQGDVKSLRIPLPKIDEQQEINKVLSDFDFKISALENEARLHEELFLAIARRS